MTNSVITAWLPWLLIRMNTYRRVGDPQIVLINIGICRVQDLPDNPLTIMRKPNTFSRVRVITAKHNILPRHSLHHLTM